MLKPLNEYYLVSLLDEPVKGGLLLISQDPDKKPIRKATVFEVSPDNELKLKQGDKVLVQQFYGQDVGDDIMLIKSEYIIAVDL